MSRDPALLVSNFMDILGFLSISWRHLLGRPTITLTATHWLIGNYRGPQPWRPPNIHTQHTRFSACPFFLKKKKKQNKERKDFHVSIPRRDLIHHSS